MNQKQSEYPLLLAIVVIFFVSGCATMTEVEREERDYSRAEWRGQFLAHRADCSARGGRLEFDGSAEQDRDGIPKYKVRYTCTLPPLAALNG
ncbi:MAG: hypothetical protein QNJ07_16575 [Woeseiaceae bacterium]|nr:hypothetical protein [Woeseiaceae bacterium]